MIWVKGWALVGWTEMLDSGVRVRSWGWSYLRMDLERWGFLDDIWDTKEGKVV